MSLARKALIAVAAATALFVLWLFAIWPPPLWYRTHWPARTAFMGMRGGERAYQPIPLDSVPSAFVQAVLIGEDHRFLTHGGIDFIEMRRAIGYRRPGFSWGSAGDVAEVIRSLPRAWRRRDAIRGASTISQQLAKNIYLSPSRNPLRKVKEAVTAYRLEAALGKHRILELYLNVVELGDGMWGVDAASRRYYGVPSSRLSRYQATALAASLPFPRLSNPTTSPGRMRARQAQILRRMRGVRIAIPRLGDEVEPVPDKDADSMTPSGESADTVPPIPQVTPEAAIP